MRIVEVSGYTVILHPMPSPIATVRVMINAGSYHEKVPGAAHFVEHMFFKGTELHNYADLNRTLASIGESNAFTSQDLTAFYINTTGAKVLQAFELLTEMIFRPLFAEEELVKERTVILEEQQSCQDNPNQFFFENSFEFIQGPKLGHPIVGTEETIMGMTRDQLLEFRQANYSRANMAFVFVGNIAHITEADIAKILSNYDLPMGTPNSVPLIRPNMGTMSVPVSLNFKHVSKQAWLALWTPGHTEEECYNLFYAPEVLLDALGGGMHSLLFQRIREELGLAYSVFCTGAFSWKNALIGHLALLQSSNVNKCRDEMLRTLFEVAEKGVPSDVLDASLSHYEFALAQEAETPASYAMAYTTGYFQNPDRLMDYESQLARFKAGRAQMPELVQQAAQKLVQGLTLTVMNGPKR